jgi:hypothetical protein
MPPRRGLSDYQQVGFGGLVFASNLNFMNLPMSYEQRLWLLEGEYYCITAFVEKSEEYSSDGKITALLQKTRDMLDQSGKDYRSEYENHNSMSGNENGYRTLICQVFGKLTDLQGKTKMIERERIVQDEV